MKIRLLIVLFPAVFVFQNCQKEKLSFFATKEDLKLLYFRSDSFLCTATKEVPGLGSVNWSANSYCNIYQGRLLIDFITFQDSIYFEQRESLGFHIPEVKTGRYTLKMSNDIADAFVSYGRWLADGDILNATWKIDPEMDNILDLQIDTMARIASGKFSIYLKMTTQGSQGFVHSEHINFHNGAFRAKY